MSLIIKGMEMPYSCYDCRFKGTWTCRAVDLRKKVIDICGYVDSRNPECPLHEISECKCCSFANSAKCSILDTRHAQVDQKDNTGNDKS